MKTSIFRKTVLILLTFCLLLPLTVSGADYNLSAGLGILAGKREIKKCGVMNNSVTFSPADFDKTLEKPEYITILTLPERAYGRLSLAGNDVKAGQTITRASLSELSFEPSGDTLCTASFTVKNAGDTSDTYSVCTIYILEGVNLAPKASGTDAETQKNISFKGYLKGYDPEEDDITFTISTPTRNGTLRLVEESSGCFSYTPKKDFVGRDTFSYFITDKYGNKSKSAKGVIHITEAAAETAFSDMTGHWAHNSAVKLYATGLFEGETVDGQLLFLPDEEISRGDFLAMAMISAGLEDTVEPVTGSTFADDSSIPYNIKGYAQKALETGIITGYTNDDGKPVFNSLSPITRSEASVIVARILGTPEPSFVRSFSDMDSVPSWAQSSVLSLCANGIISGTGYGELDPCENLTRAQCAQLLSNITDYLEEKEKQEEKPSLFNLFGLLK